MDIKSSISNAEDYLMVMEEDQWEELQSLAEESVDEFLGSLGEEAESISRTALVTIILSWWLGGGLFEKSKPKESEESETDDDGLIHLALNKTQAQNLIQFFLGVEEEL